jgi:hypothetical protein
MFGVNKRVSDRLDALEAAQRDLSEAASDLRNALANLPSELHAMRTDIDLQWEKVQRAIGRLAKREASEAASQLGDPGNSQPPVDRETQLILEGYDPWQMG